MPTILGVDISHWQGSPNFAQVKASGRSFVVLKATEGTGFVDVYCNGGYDATKKVQVPSNRANAHAAGLIVGLYHFARAGNAAAEAAYFVKTVGTLQPGEFLVLDQEVPNSVAWCQQWLDAVYRATGVRPLIYMNQSASTGLKLGNWAPVAAIYGLWLAKYDNAPGVIDSVPYWGAPAMKQFYDKGTVPGISGPCDVDVFYGSRDQLLAYGKGTPPAPPTPPPPPPIVLEDDMPTALIDPSGTVWKYTMFGMRRLNGSTPADVAISGGLQAIAGKAPTPVTWDQLNALSGECDADRKALLTDAQAYILGAAPSDDPKTWLLAQVTDIAAAVSKVQSGGVDPKAVAGEVLSGLNGAQLNVSTPPASS